MHRSLLLGTALAGVLLVPATIAQQDDRDPLAGSGLNAQSNVSFALGGVVVAPFDVEGGPFDNRCLGAEQIEINGATKYLVSGAGHTTIGVSQMIHRYDDVGTYETSFPQVTNSTLWGGRDMEAVSDGQGGYTLYIGSDNAELSEYAVDSSGNITHTALHTIGGVIGTTRALCSPDGTTFYTKSFTADFYEFTIAGGVTNFASNASVSAYGFGWDAGCGTIWSTSTGATGVEIDTGAVMTGRSFTTTLAGSQGGADVYVDSRNTGSSLSMVMLHQTTPDSVGVYELEDCGPMGPALAVSNLIAGQTATVSVSNATAGGLVGVAYSLAGAGPTSAGAGPCGSVTVDLSNPITVLPLLTADGAGNASIMQPVPANAAGLAVWLHALDIGSCTLTNSLAEVVG